MKDQLAGLLIWFFSRFFARTARVRVIGGEYLVQARAAAPAYIFATLHENAFAGMSLHAFQKYAVLCSLSRDGELVAQLARRLGLGAIRGSSSRGGLEARTGLLNAIRSGVSPAITVDGPRGPRRIAKAGVIDAARKSGAWIIPMASVSASRIEFTRSWDRFRFPLPFSRVVTIYMPPIVIPPNCQAGAFEAKRIEVEEALQKIEHIAAEVLGRADVPHHDAKRKIKGTSS
jgi:lysophospholipid acyltransferase (LPLAT)-like uncharacterized protein